LIFKYNASSPGAAKAAPGDQGLDKNIYFLSNPWL